MQTDQHFFDTVRPIFGGRLTALQVEGMQKIVAYAVRKEYNVGDTAFMLGQIKHETADWMQPLREGARRFGPNNYTDRQARNAVKAIYDKRIIRTNYALPTGPFNQSYYGRGLIQITWIDNYRKFERILGKPLQENPDLALDWDISLDIAFIGCRDGVFRTKAMSDYTFPAEFRAARDIVNGDTSTNGALTAKYAEVFYKALGASAVVKPPVVTRTQKDVYKDIQRQLKSLGLYKSGIDGIWGNGSKAALDKFQAAESAINKYLGEL